MNRPGRYGHFVKAAAWASGILSVMLLSLLLTGWADADYSAKKALGQGNRQYGAARYEQALAAYEAGLAADPENEALNFNAAQAAYIIGDYEKAAAHYEKSGDSVEKYLNGGNIFFRVGDAVEDENDKAQCYAEALLIYREGIVKYPQNVPLKYNYELVKEKLEQLMEDMEQEGDGESGEDSEDGEDGNEGESQSGEEGDEEEGEGQSGEEGDEEEGEEGASQDSQEQDEEDQGESGEGEEQEAESAEGADENEDGDEEGNASRDADSDQEQDDSQQSAYDQEDAEGLQDREAIERILEVLESQEQESLKNNQNVVRGKEGKNGW